ncbi:hypothetical protein BC937DRAFT_92504 [Endogone sp. FLAS-F59071]|nr:hypothetical protein BC937DRAFT_92504 [Endogone sp. FLAS-F59071]RUS23385.1 hypothetical protein BC937DRAFT_92504 [Endogone sp. FLAS-F59071]|eukprot:RUS23384.1 hypothetical protein BC937DRAFT_92504 [Endogone sp. FLAS-F59071]
MRTVSLVDRLKWSFTGNMNPHAFAIGDVDNDGDNEFVLGNLNGDLAIFKGECPSGTPAVTCRGLGTITCVAVGDIRNYGKNSVVCINAEGQVHIFDLPCPNDRSDVASIVPSLNTVATTLVTEEKSNLLASRRSSLDAATMSTFRTGRRIGHHHVHQHHLVKAMERPTLTLNVPVNVNRMLIADIDGDGYNELVLARTDRILHSLQLQTPNPPPPNPPPPPNTVTSSVVGPSGVVPRTSTSSSTTKSTASTQSNLEQRSAPPTINASQAKDRPQLPPRASTAHEMNITTAVPQYGPVRQDSTSTMGLGNREKSGGRAFLLHKGQWVFDAQITSLAISPHPSKPKTNILLVAQPGNTFTIVNHEGTRLNRDFTPQQSRNQPTPAPPPTPLRDEQEKEESFLVRGGSMTLPPWPTFDEDDCVETELMDVPTEIALGRGAASRAGRAASSEILAGEKQTDVIGLLSMDGELTLYDLVTHNSAHYELQVTHKLFGLCTLNTASSYYSRPASPNYHGSSSSNDCSATSIAASPISVTVDSTPFGSRRESLLEKDEVLGRSESEELGKADIPLENEGEENEGDDGDDEQSEQDTEEQASDMFVVCAWNGTTYLIDWSAAAEEMMSRAGEDAGGAIREETGMEVESVERSDDEWKDEGEFVTEQKPEKEEGGNEKNEKEKRKFHVVKFTFEERVCAFAAGLYAVSPGHNVPCLFYVDFEDQIWVYYDVHISPRPVVGFLDVMEGDIEEALERIVALEETTQFKEEPSEETKSIGIDPGDGWRGIAGGSFGFGVGKKMWQAKREGYEVGSEAEQLELPDYIHRCLYDFAELKEEMEAEIKMLERILSPGVEPTSPSSPLTPTQVLHITSSINVILANEPSLREGKQDEEGGSGSESIPTPTPSTIAAGTKSRSSPMEIGFERDAEQMGEMVQGSPSAGEPEPNTSESDQEMANIPAQDDDIDMQGPELVMPSISPPYASPVWIEEGRILESVGDNREENADGYIVEEIVLDDNSTFPPLLPQSPDSSFLTETIGDTLGSSSPTDDG